MDGYPRSVTLCVRRPVERSHVKRTEPPVPGRSIRTQVAELKTRKNNPHKLSRMSTADQALNPLKRLATLSPMSGRYNLSISHQHRFVWFRVAKNGTRTLLRSMALSGVRLDVDQAYRVRYSIRAYREYYKFAVARNPWDRLVSCWHGRVLRKNAFKFPEKYYRRMRDFSAFVDHVAGHDLENCDAHIALQSSLIDLNELDYLIRMESYEEDIAHVFRTIGIDGFEISSDNRTNDRRYYEEYYNDETRDKVGRIYEKDVRLFGYHYGQSV